MKSKFLLILMICCTYLFSNAQWSGTNPIYTLNSSVGIGTNAPSQKLQIKGGSFLVGSGASPNTSSGIRITAPINSTNYNWLIGASNNVTNGFEITPSTATGGTTFSTPAISILYGGNVGIGITTPGYKLDIAGAINISSGNTYNINGTPHTHSQYSNKSSSETISAPWTHSADLLINSTYKLNFGSFSTSNISFSSTNHNLLFQIDDYSADNFFQFQGKNAAGTNKILAILKPRGGVEFYYDGDKKFETVSYGVYMPGSLNIGVTTTSSYKLNVWGKIRAHEVVVNTDGADFVFEPNYKLPSLSEVEQFIRSNKHLPGMASSAEMQENGMNISEMQTKMLQKIEELTLYTIELNKKCGDQALEIANLKKKLGSLKEDCKDK